MRRQGKRKARGAKDRLASPAQMARLRAALGLKLATPIPFEAWRHMMRQHMNPDANIETREAAWAHLNRPDAEEIARWQVVLPLLQALHEERLAREAATWAGDV